jgi:hypothetical protein
MAIVPIKTAAQTSATNRPDIVARVRVRRPAVVSDTTQPVFRPAASDVSSTTQKEAPSHILEQAPPGSAPKTVENIAYEVGYGRPPKHSQFRKGQSGNPKGRPKGAKGFNTIVRETMTSKLKIRTANGRKSVTNVQALMMQALESALKGSRQDRHELLRYYRDAVPEEAGTTAQAAAAAQAEPEDTDAHDRAILERLRATIIAGLGDER